MARPDPVTKVRIHHAPLSNRIVLARFGADETLALGMRDATSEFCQALVSFVFGGKMPDPGQAGEISFGGEDEQFTVTVTRKGGAS